MGSQDLANVAWSAAGWQRLAATDPALNLVREPAGTASVGVPAAAQAAARARPPEAWLTRLAGQLSARLTVGDSYGGSPAVRAARRTAGDSRAGSSAAAPAAWLRETAPGGGAGGALSGHTASVDGTGGGGGLNGNHLGVLVGALEVRRCVRGRLVTHGLAQLPRQPGALHPRTQSALLMLRAPCAAHMLRAPCAAHMLRAPCAAHMLRAPCAAHACSALPSRAPHALLLLMLHIIPMRSPP